MALQTQWNIVAYGTYLQDFKSSIVDYDILVVILYSRQSNALLPFSLAENIRTIREVVGYEVLWPATFVIDDENDEVNISVITKISKLSYIFLHFWFVFLMSYIYLYVFRMLTKGRIKRRRYKHLQRKLNMKIL